MPLTYSFTPSKIPEHELSRPPRTNTIIAYTLQSSYTRHTDENHLSSTFRVINLHTTGPRTLPENNFSLLPNLSTHLSPLAPKTQITNTYAPSPTHHPQSRIIPDLNTSTNHTPTHSLLRPPPLTNYPEILDPLILVSCVVTIWMVSERQLDFSRHAMRFESR